MTQPVYDPEVLRRFLVDTRSLGLPVLVVCAPSPRERPRNAEFLHNEVTGDADPRTDPRAHGQGGDAGGRAEGRQC